MHSLCCWPPERLAPDFFLRCVFDFFPQRRLASETSPRSHPPLAIAHSIQLQSSRYIVVDGHRRKRIRFLKHHTDSPPHIHRRSPLHRCRFRQPRLLPSTFVPGIVSCMRFRHRTNVDLPQPEGPMSRRHLVRSQSSCSCRAALPLLPYQAFRLRTSIPTPIAMKLPRSCRGWPQFVPPSLQPQSAGSVPAHPPKPACATHRMAKSHRRKSEAAALPSAD